MANLVNECRDTFDRTDLRLACGKLAQLLKGCAQCWHLGRGVLEPSSNVAWKRLQAQASSCISINVHLNK